MFNIATDQSEIITSAYATAVFLNSISRHESSTNTYVIGSGELKVEMKEMGINVVEDHRNNKTNFLVVNFDRDFSYEKIAIALDVLSSGAKFVACNRDRTFPVERGIMPGCGSMVAAIEWPWVRRPDYEVGKPNTFFLKMITKETNYSPSQIMVIGDTPASDIAMAINFGSPSVLISGDAREKNTEFLPKLRISSLADLIDMI